MSIHEASDALPRRESRKTLTTGSLPFGIHNSCSEKRSNFTKSLINALNLNQDFNANKNYCEYWLEHGQRRASPANSLRESTKQDSNFLTTNHDLGAKNLSVKSRRENYAKSLVDASSQNSVFSKNSSSEKVNMLPKSRSKSEALISVPHAILVHNASTDSECTRHLKHDRSPSRKSFKRTDSWHSSRKFSIKNLFSVNSNNANSGTVHFEGSMSKLYHFFVFILK